ncbi:TITIN protein, partial [Pluvianellus socialis]|nr:TITIN protein [Pluvianellus socialis]
RTIDGKAWTKVNANCGSTSFVVPDLISGQEYFFRVRAENRFGVGPPAETIQRTTARDPIHPPDPPIKLKIGLVTKNTVSLTWKPPKNDGGAPVTHYNVECLRWDRTGEVKETWKQCNRRDVEETKFTVEDLVEGGEYEFRVKAVNIAGPSRPSATVGPLVVKDQTCPPSIELKEFMEVEEGTDVNIVAKIKGVPFPTLTWLKASPKKPDDKTPVAYDQHVNKIVGEDTCTLLIQQSRRSDTGLYTITAVNNLGTASKEMRLNVLGRPGPPVGPIKFESILADKMTISWLPPLDDGGSKITNYVIEKKEANRRTWDAHRDLWMPVTSATVKTTCKIPKLLEGRDYQIRIYAENLYGISDPLISDEMKAKDRFRVPDAPEQPIIKNVTKDSAVVVWNKPYDGGKPITNYIVEKKETMATRWVRVTKDPIFPSTQFKVPDLLEGCQYEFRVSAENEIGVGDPSPPSKPIFARDPIAKPSPPINPEAIDKTKNSVDLSWQPPRHDGNGKIIGYLVEYQKVGDEEWKKANLAPDSCPETNYKVTGLTEGLTYKFRVKAVNAAGESEPAYVPEPVEVKDRLEPPELILDANMAREQHVKAGDTLRLSAVIKGVPFPKVSWKKEDHEVSPKADIEVTGVGSKLEIRNTVHEDGGTYSLTVENPAGSKTVSVKVVVLDKPGPPRNLQVSEVRSDSCYLTWMEPEDDGGSVITNYVVERKDVASAQWVAISSSSKKRSHMAKYLMEGTQYLFRVAAENQFGRGPYVETLKPIKAIDPL